jgi:dihydrofolate reductase
MRKIVYYVACSLDGFIAGLNGDVSSFVSAGNGVEQYLTDLADFDTVIMGRNTYEFGYQYGLLPGQPAYSHMRHYIFSNHLVLENSADTVHVKPVAIAEIEQLQMEDGTDIYLCGGGELAGWLLNHQKIDVLKLKLNPIILGQGVKLFGHSTTNAKLQFIERKSYENGSLFLTYEIQY